MRLHTSIGPSHASIAAIADEAAVTRLTVYRHYRDLDEIFTACMGHWARLHPGPDPAAWATLPDLALRARHALGALYDWFEDVGNDLYPIRRDIEAVPAGARQAIRAQEAALAASIVGDGPANHDATDRVRAIVGHLVTFETWRSLVVEQGLGSDEAVEVAVEWIAAVVDRHSEP